MTDQQHQQSPLLGLHALLSAMRTHAASGEWQHVGSAEQEKHSLIACLSQLQTPLSVEQTQLVASIRALDREILDLATAARQHAAQALRGLSQQQAVSQTYLANQTY